MAMMLWSRVPHRLAQARAVRAGMNPLCWAAGWENSAIQLGLHYPLQGQNLGSGHSDGTILLAPNEAWAPFPHGHSDSWGQSCCHGHRVQLGDAPPWHNQQDLRAFVGKDSQLVWIQFIWSQHHVLPALHCHMQSKVAPLQAWVTSPPHVQH